MNTRKRFPLCLLMLFGATFPAHAYIDPVTGSFVLQGLIAGAAAALVFFRSLRDRVIGFFRPKKQSEDVTEDNTRAEVGDD